MDGVEDEVEKAESEATVSNLVFQNHSGQSPRRQEAEGPELARGDPPRQLKRCCPVPPPVRRSSGHTPLSQPCVFSSHPEAFTFLQMLHTEMCVIFQTFI